MILKKTMLILLVAVILSVPMFTYAEAALESYPVIVEYFGVDGCLSCVRAQTHMDEVIPELKSLGHEITLIKHDIKNTESEKHLIALNNALNIEDAKYKLVPAVFIGDRYLIGDEDIEEGLRDLIIRSAVEGQNEVILGDQSFRVQPLELGGIFMAGLLDGINPCSIAMMLFFISIVMADIKSKNKNAVLRLGLSFVSGVFVAYLGIGIGLFNFLYSLSNMEDIMLIFYLALFWMGILLMIANLKDYYHIRNGEEKKIKNQLSKKTKKKIHDHIRKMSKKKSKGLYVMAFVTAFGISFMEFFCTGQIYLPTITYMIRNSTDLGYIFLLILYNFAFVLPLMIITFFLHFGKEVIDVSSILLNKLHIIKMLGAIFFFVVAIYSINQINILI